MKLVADLQAQTQQLTQARDGQTKLANERLVQIDQLTKNQEEQSQQLTERQEQIGQLNNELRQANQSINLVSKLQTLRESDLEDLQQRYKSSIETQNRQHELLIQLEDRLRVAAKYFHDLQEQQLLAEEEPEPTPAKKRRSTRRKLKS